MDVFRVRQADALRVINRSQETYEAVVDGASEGSLTNPLLSGVQARASGADLGSSSMQFSLSGRCNSELTLPGMSGPSLPGRSRASLVQT